MATLKTNVPAQADTAYGAAGTETGVPGFVDVSGNSYKIVDNEVISFASTSNLLRNKYLSANDPLSGTYTYLNAGEGDQYVEFRIKPGTRDVGRKIYLRHSMVTPGSFYVSFQGVLDPTARFAQLSISNGGASTNQNTPVFGLNNTDEYKIRFGVSGTTALGTAAIYVYIKNMTTDTDHIWSSGTATYTWNPGATSIPDTGTISFFANNNSGGGLLHAGLPIDVYTEGTAAALDTSPGSITGTLLADSATGGALTITHNGSTGGAGIKTLSQWSHATSPYFTPPASGTFLAETVNVASRTYNLTGLVPGAHTGYFINRTVDGASAGNNGSPMATIVPFMATHSIVNGNTWPVTYIIEVGDSLVGSVVGGFPTGKATSETLGELVSSYDGTTDTQPYLYDKISAPGAGAAALNDPVIYASILALIDLRQAVALFVRAGHNDSNPTTSVASILQFANQVQTDRSNIRLFFMPITPKAAPFTECHTLDVDNLAYCRAHTVLLNTLHDPTLKRFTIPPLAQLWLSRNVEAYGVADASHWDAAIYQKIGRLEAYAVFPYWTSTFGGQGANAITWNGFSATSGGGGSDSVNIRFTGQPVNEGLLIGSPFVEAGTTDQPIMVQVQEGEVLIAFGSSAPLGTTQAMISVYEKETHTIAPPSGLKTYWKANTSTARATRADIE